MEIDLAKFNPTLQELTKLVDSTKGVTAKDLKDEEQMAIVKENRTLLQKARIAITKTGKGYRSDALAYQKAVIVKEKELLAVIEPEETRLKGIEEEAKNLELMEERKKLLPWRKEQLLKLGDGEEMPTEEELLDMDDAIFKEHLTERKAAKLDKVEAEAEEAEQEAKHEDEKKEAADKAVEDEKKRVAQEAKDKEIEEEEAQKTAEKNTAYKAWLKKNGYTEKNKDSYKITREGDTFTIYKLLDTITIE